MLDQASELRQLVLQAAQHQADAHAAPQIISVAGGQVGVGTTTIAVNLATDLTHRGHRVLLVDADFCGDGALTRHTEFVEDGLYTVLDGSKTITQATTTGPLGMQVLNLGRVKQKQEVTREMQQSLLESFRNLSDDLDFVILDVGSESHTTMRRFWLASHLVLLVTTPADQVIMSTYAMVKTLIANHGISSLQTIVNQVDTIASGDEVYRRMANACQRFLGYQLQYAGPIARYAGVPLSDQAVKNLPWILADSTSAAAESVTALARKVLALLNRSTADEKIENQATHLARTLSTQTTK